MAKKPRRDFMSHHYSDLLLYISELTIIDTHEHLPPYEAKRNKNADVLSEYLSHYFNRDLVSAGLSKKDHDKAVDPSGDLPERWKLVEPYWDKCRFTGYGRSLDLTVQALYGIERIDGDTIAALNSAFQKTVSSAGHYRKVLKELCQIETSLLDAGTLDVDRDIFTPIPRIDCFITPDGVAALNSIGEESGVEVTGFTAWLRAAETLLEKWTDSGVRIFKSGLAYQRPLLYERVTRHEAETQFNALFYKNHEPDWYQTSAARGKAFEDYMMHFVLGILSGKKVTLQVHTGLQEGNGNLLYNSDPGLLSNLFLAYPNVDFDLFHIGYPFQNVVGALSKNFANVFIDMCWAHIISPNACVSALHEWLDAVPYNKISAFGGDYCMIDTIYGHQRLARENVAKALAGKVDEGAFQPDTAKRIAKALFYDNPREIFKLK